MSWNNNSVSRGWRAAWCDPDLFQNIYVKEVIKGPFPSPKIACLLPYFNESQRHCWGQFLKPNVKRTNKNQNQMTKENENLIDAVRNNYGLSIGHGIPDPWITAPYCGFSHSHNDEITDFLKKFIFQLLETKKNTQPCFCCEKKYLFGCPDKNEIDLKNLKDANTLNCSCPNCHGKNDKPQTECGENCNCIKTIKNWVLENSALLREKSQVEAEKEEIASLCSVKLRKTRSKTPEILQQGESQTCNCHTNTESSTLKTSTLKTTTSEDKTKKISIRRSLTPQRSKVIVSSSKESQDETSESDMKKPCSRNSTDSYFKTCQCFIRRSSCGMHDNRSPNIQRSHSGQCYVNYNVPYQISSSSPFLSTPVRETSTQPSQEKKKKDRKLEKKKKKEKKKKENCEISDSQSKSQDSQLEDSSSLLCRRRSSILKNVGIKTSNNISEKSESRVLYTPPLTLSLDSLKYLTDHNLKKYIQRRELSKNSMSSQYSSLQSISPLSSTFKNLCEGESLGLVALQKCKPIIYQRRDNTESSCDESKSGPREWLFRPATRKFNFGAQTSLSIIDEIDSPEKDIPTNVKFFKEVVESDESGINVPLRSYDRTYRENRIRRRLIANRKRRRKLLTKRHWYTASSKTQNVAHKFVQANETSEDSMIRSRNVPCEKRVSFDFDVSGSRIFTVPSVSSWQILEERTESSSKRLSDKKMVSSNRYSNLENVLDKISYNSGTSWSSNTLKNIVDDLIVEKKPTRYMVIDAGNQTSNKNL